MALSKEQEEKAKGFFAQKDISSRTVGDFRRSSRGRRAEKIKPQVSDNIFSRFAAGVRQVGTGVEQRIRERGGETFEALERERTGEQGTVRTAGQVAGQGLGAVADVAFEGVKGLFRALPGFIEDPIRDVGQRVEQFATEKFIPDVVAAQKRKFEQLQVDNPQQAQEISDLVTRLQADEALQGDLKAAFGAADFIGLGAAGKVAGAGREFAEESIEKVASRFDDTILSALRDRRKPAKGDALTGEVLEGEIVKEPGLARSVGSAIAEKTREVGQKLKTAPERIQINAAARKAARQEFETLPERSKSAVSNGLLVRDVNLIEQANDANKDVFRRLVQSSAGFEANRTGARPSAILGEEFTKRLTSLDSEIKKAGGVLDKAIEPINTQVLVNSADNMIAELQKVKGLKGIKIADDGTLDFSQTTISGSGTSSERKTLQAAFDDAAKRNAGEAHRFRQELFEDLGGKKTAGIKTTATSDQGINAIRKGLANSLEDVSPQYKEANQGIAELLDSQKQIRKVFGDVAKGDEDIFNVKSSILLRRLTSNAKSGQDIAELIQDVEKLLGTKGVKFDTSLQEIQDFLNLLNRYYDISGDTSLLGVLKTSDIPSGTRDLLSKIVDQITEVGQSTPETAKKAIDDLLGGSDFKQAAVPQTVLKIDNESSIIAREAKRLDGPQDKLIQNVDTPIQDPSKSVKDFNTEEEFLDAFAADESLAQVKDKDFTGESLFTGTHGKVDVESLTPFEHDQFSKVRQLGGGNEKVKELVEFLLDNPTKDTRPVLVLGKIDDPKNFPQVQDGHHRTQAYIEAGRKTIPFQYARETLSEIWNSSN